MADLRDPSAGALAAPPRFSRAAIDARVRSLRRRMVEEGLEALIVYSSPPDVAMGGRHTGNVRYLTDWKPAPTTSPSLLVLPAVGEPQLLIAPGVYAEADQDIWVTDILKASVREMGERAGDRLAAEGWRRVGVVGGDEMPTLLYRGLAVGAGDRELLAADELLGALRMIKDPEELERMRTAARIADSMIEVAFEMVRQGRVTAARVMLGMEDAGRQLGAGLARCWLAVGPAPVQMFSDPFWLDRRVEQGDRFHTGVYVVYDGYWGHELRAGVRGRVAPGVRAHFDAARAVQDAGIAALRPGAPMAQVRDAMEGAIRRHRPDALDPDPHGFAHGHGLGLEYNDPLVTDVFRDRTIAAGPRVHPGMVLEMHPNFVTPAHGMGFVGDMVLATDGAAELLTSLPRELVGL